MLPALSADERTSGKRRERGSVGVGLSIGSDLEMARGLRFRAEGRSPMSPAARATTPISP